MAKKKILLLSDDLRMTSGIANVSKQLVLGTVDKYDWVQLGAAIKHPEAGKVLDLNDSAGNTAYIGMQFYDSSNTLINGNEYAHSANELKSYGSFDNTWATTNANQIGTISLSGNDDARGGGALIKVFNADDSSLFTHINSFSSCVNDSGANGFWAMGMHKTAETVSGFRFYNNTYDNDLTVSVYGVQD